MKKFFTQLTKTTLTLALLAVGQSANAQYCNTSMYTYGCGSEWINSFSTTGGATNITNNSSGCTGGSTPAVFTQTHTQAIGTTVNYSLTNGGCCDENIAIFVDWNCDGDWVDAGETVAAFGILWNATVTGSFIVPNTATPGNSRMRVRMVWGGTPAAITPCGSFGWGEAEDYGFVISSPCVAPNGLNATGIFSSGATVSWNAVSPSVNYDYAVTTSATPPSTGFTSITGTSANVTGLTPFTQYYLHVRNKCTSTSPSAWVTYMFTTLPPCKPPVGFEVTNLTPNGGNINWDPWPSANTYDVIIDQSNQTPASSTGATNTPLTSTPTGTLQENTWYYVHIRSRCVGGEISDWSLDSFLTPIPCRAPDIKIDHLNTDEAVAYWANVPTATMYEYAISTSSTPPSSGTEYKFNSIHTSALDDGKDYYIHVRSHCNSIGIISTSPWGTASFRTFPVGVNSVEKKSFIEAYPNPVQGSLNINVYGVVSGNSSVTITDMSGKVLHTSTLNGTKSTIDMRNLPAGIYLLKYADDNRSSVIRVTKQ